MSSSYIFTPRTELKRRYCGRRLKDDVNLEEVSGMDLEDGDALDGTEYNEEPALGEDGKPLPIWSRYTYEVDYRGFLDEMDLADDDDDEYDDADDDDEEWDEDDEEYEDDEDCYEEYDERQNWNLTTFISIEVTDRVITGIEIGCRVSCWGDSGLGEEDPDEVWADKDLDLVAELMDEILEDRENDLTFDYLSRRYIGRRLHTEKLQECPTGDVNHVEAAFDDDDTWNIEFEYVDSEHCNDEGKGQTYYVRFIVTVNEDDIITYLTLDEIEQYEDEDAKGAFSTILDDDSPVFADLVDQYLAACTEFVYDIPYTFTIDTYVNGGGGDSEVTCCLSSKQFSQIMSAQEEGTDFCDCEPLASLYESIMEAAKAKLEEDLSLDPDNDIDIDDVDFSVNF